MKRNKFISLLDEAIKKKALEYLLKMRGNKGKEILYSEIQMAIYLKPNDEGLTIADKRYIFAIRNRMIYLQTNFPSNKNRDENCKNCGERETTKHVYLCDQNKENKENNIIQYEEIFGENLKNMKKV